MHSNNNEGQDAFSVVAGATVPLWRGANRAAVSEAEARRRAANSRLDDTARQIVREITTALSTLREADDLVALSEQALIPQADLTLAATQAAFSTGQASMLDLIDAERVLLRLRRTHRRAQRDHLLAIADLERAVGTAPVQEVQ